MKLKEGNKIKTLPFYLIVIPFLLCCGISNPDDILSIEITTDRTAYALGDSVFIKLFAINNSTDTLSRVSYHEIPFNISLYNNARVVWDLERYSESRNGYSFMHYPIRLDPRQKNLIGQLVWDQKDLDGRKTGKGKYLISAELRLSDPEYYYCANKWITIH